MADRTELSTRTNLFTRTVLSFREHMSPFFKFIINLLTSTSTRNSPATVFGYAESSSIAEGQFVLSVDSNTVAIQGARQVGTAWSGSANETAHTFHGDPKKPYCFAIAIGDSFTNGSNYSQWAEDEDTYAVIKETGLSGNTLQQMEDRFTRDVVSKNPRVVTIQGGINALAIAASDISAALLANATAMVDSAIASGITPILINVSAWENSSFWTAARQTYTENYNNSLASYATTNNIPLVDIYTLLRDGVALDAIYDSGDGLHPNVAGYTAIGTLLASVGGDTFAANLQTDHSLKNTELQNHDASENLLRFSKFTGTGESIDGWSLLFGPGPGSATIRDSLFGSESGENCIEFIAFNESPAIFRVEPVLANTTYTLSTYIDEITILPTAVILQITGVGIVSGAGNYLLKQEDKGEIVSITFTTDGIGGDMVVRYGVGTSLDTGQVKLSRPQLEVGSIVTPWKPTDSVTVSTLADITTVAVPSFVEQDGDWAFKFTGTPHQTAQALKALFSFDSDATNYTEIQLNAANITANSVLAGVSNGVAVGLYSHTVDVPFETNVYYVAETKTLGIRSDDVSGDISAVAFVEDVLTSHPVITTTLSVGNRNSLNQALCDIDNDGVPIFYDNKESARW